MLGAIAWFQITAASKILSGTDREVGAVRSAANEVLLRIRVSTLMSSTISARSRRDLLADTVSNHASMTRGAGSAPDPDRDRRMR